ncbi:uncharacterized protein LOC122051842 [Zingiber officinale]|uniref:uncharacterized protein LOC122051842 n=1 Tax=Zingiber officinale TaxID=94328 RepID=UPI001C4DC560|nr:uncharacterized protein LOC122051842 [Zingiber officinale]
MLPDDDKTVRRWQRQPDPDAYARLMTDQNNKRRREQGGRLEDRLTSLHDDLLIFILSFLSIKQRVALSAVCARFHLLQPSIPRLDAFRLEVRFPSDSVDVHKDLTIPRALIRQFHLVFHFVADLLIPHENQLVDALVDTGVQNLTLEASGNGFLYLSDRENYCIFNIKSKICKTNALPQTNNNMWELRFTTNDP